MSEPESVRCAADCPKCADEYLAAKEADERGLPCAECGQIAYPPNYECACNLR